MSFQGLVLLGLVCSRCSISVLSLVHSRCSKSMLNKWVGGGRADKAEEGDVSRWSLEVPGAGWRLWSLLWGKGCCGPGEGGGGCDSQAAITNGGRFLEQGPRLEKAAFSSTPVLHAHQARQSRSCPWLSPGSGGDALSPQPLPSPERGVKRAQQSHPGELTAPLPTSAFLSRGDVRISSLRRGALAHLWGGLTPGLDADSRLSQDASPNHGPGPPCLNCLRASSWGGHCLSPRFLKSRQLLRARESREDYDCRPSPITPSSCPGPPGESLPSMWGCHHHSHIKATCKQHSQNGSMTDVCVGWGSREEGD